MFWFWLIFLIIAIGCLFSYKKSAREVAKSWVGNEKEAEAILRYVNLIIGAALTLVGILGILGIIKIR